MRADSFVTNTWYVAGFSEEFPVGKLTGQTIAGKPLVIWRAASAEVVAFDGRCVHKRMPLKDGRLLPDGTLHLTGLVARADGSFLLKRGVHGAAADAARLGAELGASLRADSPPDIFS